MIFHVKETGELISLGSVVLFIYVDVCCGHRNNDWWSLFQWPILLLLLLDVFYIVGITIMTPGHYNNDPTSHCYDDRWSLQQWPVVIIFHWGLIFTLIGKGDCGIFTIIKCIAWLKENLCYTGSHAHSSKVLDISFMGAYYVERLPRLRVWHWEGYMDFWLNIVIEDNDLLCVA